MLAIIKVNIYTGNNIVWLIAGQSESEEQTLHNKKKSLKAEPPSPPVTFDLPAEEHWLWNPTKLLRSNQKQMFIWNGLYVDVSAINKAATRRE